MEEEQQAAASEQTAAPVVDAPVSETDIGNLFSPDNSPVDNKQEIDTVEGSEPSEHPQENAKPENEQPEGDSEGQATDAKTTEVYELKLSDGTEAKVTLDELKSGYLRQADYTKKTAEIPKLREELQQGYTQLETNLINGMQQLLQEFDPAAPLMQQREALIAEIVQARDSGDTVEYTAKRLDLNDIEAQIAAINHKKDLIFKAGTTQTEQQVTRNIEQERTKLFERLPELATPEKAKEFSESAYNALKHVGYSDQDLQELQRNPDARQAELSYYAGKYLEMQKAVPQVAQALKDKVVTPKASAVPPAKNMSSKALDILKTDPNNQYAIGALFAPG